MNSDGMERYLAGVQRRLSDLLHSQRQTLDTVADRVAEAFLKEGWWFVFGTGHSHMLAEELFFRAGGSPRVRPILVEDLMLHVSASASSEHERVLGRAAELLESYPVTSKDVLLLASNSGRNAVPIELAQAARQRGAFTVALTSLAHARAFPSRHPSGLRLDEVVDVVVDHGAPVGDASVALDDEGHVSAGAVSTVLGAAVLQMIHVGAMERLRDCGKAPEVFISSNAAGGDHNEALLEAYRPQVRHL